MGTQPALRDVTNDRRQSRLRLLAPIRYLAIYHPEKFKYDYYYPLAFAILAWGGYNLLFSDLAFFGDHGLLKFARDLLIMAVPFLVGALASVAMGAPGRHIDQRPLGADLWLDDRKLTLRQFVCYLLGYLCFLGMFILGISVIAALIEEKAKIIVSMSASYAPYIINAIVFMYFIIIAAFCTTVLWTLYFLTDIVNRPAVD